MEDIKLIAKNENELETLIQAVKIYSDDKDEILHRKICHANYEKQKTTNDGSNKSTISRKKSERSK